jgi:uncharacterized RDD family membrane protein YckC
LSTSVNPIDFSPVGPSSTWKQEVNRRVAAHRKNRPAYAEDQTSAREIRNDPGSRAAQAAARVAARYAKAPSYSEMLAGEARAAMLAAEAATKAAQAAQAAAQSVLNSLEAATEAKPASGFDRPPEVHGRYQSEDSTVGEDQAYAIRWEANLPAPRQAPAAARGGQKVSLFDAGSAYWPEPEQAEEEADFGLIEPVEPIPGNLIEFPRELVATRRVRPRRVEGPLAAGGHNAQMSIFEVDPGAISIELEALRATDEQAGPAGMPAWTGPEWSGIQLDAHPEEAPMTEVAPQIPGAHRLELASANRRLLAAVVDASLVAGGFLLLAIPIAIRAAALPGLHTLEIACALGLAMAGALYETLFFTMGWPTPGMRYAQLRLCTLEGHAPTRTQRHARLVALLLSVLPIGLGLAWAIFDDEHLTWHDRLSRTYLRLR